MTTTLGPAPNGPLHANCGPRLDLFYDLGRCINPSGDNTYDMYEPIKERYGVYIFLDAPNNSSHTLYVGEARDQSLMKRITQNYTKNSGGTFRDNWAAKHGGREISKGDSKQERIDKRVGNLGIFKIALRSRGWRIITISFPQTQGGQKRRQDLWIHGLEKILIGFLDPKYNKD